MGFYIELKKTDAQGNEFREQKPPQVFWTLFGLAGFALTCMGLAAHALLRKLLTTGDPWDLAMVGAILSFVPFYLAIGIKLLCIRKYIEFAPQDLFIGYRIGNSTFRFKTVKKTDVGEVLLINQKPSANLAPAQHTDPQYYIRGHWRLILKTKNGRLITLDRHTEKGALNPLENRVKEWVG
jgi:hypothetical protein